MTYILPTSTAQLPGSLTLEQFIQTVLVGLSGLAGPFVRPTWQPNPPKMPDNDVNWLAFGITSNTPDANAYVGVKADGSNDFQRHELLDIDCAFYGPLALANASLVRDGFQIQQNLEAMRAADMGFAACEQAIHLPELINERWFNRYQMKILLRRQIRRVYPVLTLLSANGTIHSMTSGDEYSSEWQTPEED